MFTRRGAGAPLIVAGLAIVACYAVLVWTMVFENDQATQVCGPPGNSHRDNFFPPYTVCGTGTHAFRVTPGSVSFAGATLLVLGVALVLIGIALVIQRRRRAQQRLSPAVRMRPAPDA